MEWCKTESEKAIDAITIIISNVFTNARQASAMSDEVLEALHKIKGKKKAGKAEENQDHRLKQLREALIDLHGKHAELGDTINPIIESLQFQDRIAQKLDNVKKMMAVWEEHRNSATSFEEFGKLLHARATMADERQILCKFFKNLPASKEVKGSLLF